MNKPLFRHDIGLTEHFEDPNIMVLGSIRTYTAGVPCKEVRDFTFLHLTFNRVQFMNDPAVKVALAISVLVGGVFIAIVFRPFFSSPHDTVTGVNTPLNLQHPGQPPIPTPSQANAYSLSAGQKFPASSASSQGPTILSPLGPPQPVPNLPPRYPSTTPANGARWGMPMDMMPIVARSADTPAVHKIVDGDKLGDLAARYLGSPNRAMQIFEANRDVLTDPELLPIGVELKIPAREK